MDSLIETLATRFKATGGDLIGALGGVPSPTHNDFEQEVHDALAADQAALEAANDRIDTTLIYVDGQVDAALDEARSLIDGLSSRIDDVVPVVATTESLIDDFALNLTYLSTKIFETDQRIADAGIYLDPESGTVRIAALEQVDTRISAAEVNINAAMSEITSRVTVAEMNQALSDLVLDPSQIPIVTDLTLRVGVAEEAINALTATIVEKASNTVVNGIDVRLTSAESEIDGLNAEILLKATNADLTAVESRVSNAEVSINALDAPAITQTVFDTSTQYDEIDTEALNSLEDLLEAYRGREADASELALARQEISAEISDGREALTAAKVELAARIDGNEALLKTEQLARASGDETITASLSQMSATVDENAAQIANEQAARASGDDALAASLSSLSTAVGQNTASIVAEIAARVNADEALSASVQSLETNLNGVSASVTQHASTLSTMESFAAATYTIRLGAGGSAAGFEIVTSDDPINGQSSSIRFNAENIIANGTIYGQHIAAGSINASKLNVLELSAIAANIGTLRSALTGERVIIQDDKISVYDANNVLRVRIGDLTT